MIVKNSAMCLKCNEEIESRHVHDFVRCKCGDIAVDGGKYYMKRSFATDAQWRDTSVYREDEKDDSSRKV